MQDETKGMLLGGLGVVAFGLTLPATRFVVPYMDPIFIGLGRAVLAALVAAVLLLLARETWPTRRQLARLAVVSLGVVAGFPILSAWAMKTVPAAHGGVVLGILPLATAAVGVLISHERPSPGFWLASVAGSVLVVAYSLLKGVGGLAAGDLLLLGAILSAAIGYAVGGQLSREMGGWKVICWALVLALPFIALPAWSQMPGHMLQLPAHVWESFLYLALVSQLFGFFLWNRGLALGGIARVSQTQLIQPFVTLLASVALLGEHVDAATVGFAVLVVATVAVGKRMPIRQRV